MTITERKRFGFQGVSVWLTSLLFVASMGLFVGAGILMTQPTYGEATWADAITEGAKVGVTVVDQAAKKEVVWLAMAAACISMVAVIISMGLTFWIAISGVKAIDRLGHIHGKDPWAKDKR